MLSLNRPTIAAIIVLFVFGALILFAPKKSENEKGTDSGYLWKNSWTIIDYFPANSSSIDKNPRTPFRLIKRAGFFIDNFEIAEIEEQNGQTIEKKDKIYRASGLAKNIFTNWEHPGMTAAYTLDSLKDIDTGITKDSPRILFYDSGYSKPVIVHTGNTTKKGTIYIATDISAHSNMVFIVSSSLIDRLQNPIVNFRERRIFIYPTNSYTEEISIIKGTDKASKKFTLHQKFQNSQEKTESGKETKIPVWTNEKGKIVPNNKAVALENFCKNLHIQYFTEEDAVSQFGETQKLWSASKEKELHLTINIYRGEKYKVVLKKPPQEIKIAGKELILLRSNVDNNIHFADANLAESIYRTAQETETGSLNEKQNFKSSLKNE